MHVFMRHMIVVLLLFILGNTGRALASDIPITSYGAIGDGVTDDTANVQRAFDACSNEGARCVVPFGKTFKITNRLFMWGEAGIFCQTPTDGFSFNGNGTNLINFGLRAMTVPATVWSGTLQGCTYKVTGQPGGGGRILFFWRTDGATITQNTFLTGPYAYGPTSSGNNQAYVQNCEANAYSLTNPCVRRNITITRNTVIATADNLGSEGVGLGLFDNALIEDNDIRGVGDDPIGIHFSTNIRILNNRISSTDGRVFVSNSRNVIIEDNHIARAARVSDGKFFKGIALIYIGFEHGLTSNLSAPVDITIVRNVLTYPVGAIDAGASIYLYGVRQTYVAYNQIYSYSTTQPTIQGIYILPFPFSGTWTDPDGIDPSHVARVHAVTLHNNSTTSGPVGLSMIMSGNCVDYVGPLTLTNNRASRFQFYCGYVSTGVYQPITVIR